MDCPVASDQGSAQSCGLQNVALHHLDPELMEAGIGPSTHYRANRIAALDEPGQELTAEHSGGTYNTDTHRWHLTNR
jgi:hypothetical protein